MTDEMPKQSGWTLFLRGMWDVVKAVSTIAVVVVLCVKIYVTPTTLTVDFPTLLSLLLALFSVALAALFYFKATDTSNTFYDNTYKFTRDIAQLLAKIESGFGERLRHLDEGYSSMRNYFRDGRSSDVEEVDKAKEQLKTEKKEVDKAIEERNKIVSDLIERSHLEKEEKEQIAARLRNKEEELAELQKQVSLLHRRVAFERARRNRLAHEEDGMPLSGMSSFAIDNVVEKIGAAEILEKSFSEIRREFSQLMDDLPSGFISDLKERDYFDKGLTMRGFSYLKSLARRVIGRK